MDSYRAIAYNASGDMLWLSGADLDAPHHADIEGARNVQTYMQNLKYAPRYNEETGRFTRNRVALIVIYIGGHEERWARTADGSIVRILLDGTIIENGMSASPECNDPKSFGYVHAETTLRLTRHLRRRPHTAAAEAPRRSSEATVPVDEPEAVPTAEAKTRSTAIKLLDPLRPCRRCKATGTFHIWSGPVQCRTCGGTGQVPSVRDAKRIREADANYYRLIKMMRTRAEERDGRRNGRIEFESHQGFGLLEQNEPHRLPALFRSLEAGRVDDVIDALIAYRDARVVKESA